MNIYVDEAGNTGQDLLNVDQPIFVLASHNYAHEEIRKLRDIFEMKGELHFKNIKDSAIGRKNLLEFINHPLISEERINVVIADKFNVACGHIVDRLMEPVYFDENIDIYSGKQNMALNSFLHVFGLKNWDRGLFEEFVSSFIQMARIKTPESIELFYQVARRLYDAPNTKERKLLVTVLKSQEQIDEILSYIDKFALDVTLSSFLTLCHLWFVKSKVQLTVFHDNSKQLEFYEFLLEKLIDVTKDVQIVQMGTQEVTLPYQVKKLKLVDSKDFLGVQIADLIGSTLSFNYNNKNSKQQPFVEQIQNSKLFNLSNHFTMMAHDMRSLVGYGVNFEVTKRNIDFLAKKYSS